MNILDSLVYTEIKNNLKKSNYDNYDKLINILDICGNKLDDLLSFTTIKKACCQFNKSNNEDEDEYNTQVVMFNEKGETVIKSVYVNKKICEEKKIYSNNPMCDDFKTLYCENSNFLYNSDKGNKKAWNDYSPYCKSYKLLQYRKDATTSNDSDIGYYEKHKEELDSSSTKPPPSSSYIPPSTKPPAPLSTPPSTPPSPPPKPETEGIIDVVNKNKNYLIGGSILICLCIIILIVMLVTISNKNRR